MLYDEHGSTCILIILFTAVGVNTDLIYSQKHIIIGCTSYYEYKDLSNVFLFNMMMLDIAFIFLVLPLIFFVPGYFLFNVFSKAERFDMDLSESFFLQVMGSMLISGWVALTLAEIGYFSLINLIILLFIISGALALKCEMKFNLKFIRTYKSDSDLFPLIILILIAVVLFFHPAEFIYGNADAGVYVSTGVNIVKTGSILIHDSLLGNTSDYFYESFTMKGGQYSPWSKFAGFYVIDSDSGIIAPQFLHLHPTWIAIFYSIFGLKTGLFVTPLFGLLGILSIYFAGKTIFNRQIGFIAAFILSINILQIWFSRYPTSEVLTQFLFFSGIYTLAKNKDLNSKYLWLLSALSFGELFLTRVDVIFLLFVIFGFISYYYVIGKLNKSVLFFIIPFLILLFQSSVHALYFSKPYVYDVFSTIFSTKIILIVAIAAISTTAFITLGKNLVRKYLLHELLRNQKYIKILFINIFILLGIYALFFRANTTDYQEIMMYGNIIRTYNEENLVRLGWYLTNIIIVLGIFGCVNLIWDRWDQRTSVFLMIGIIYTLFYIYDIRNNPHQIYAMRRYLPVVVPSFILWSSYLLYEIKNVEKYGRLVFILIISLLMISYLYSDTLVINHVEYQGAIDQLDTLSKFFPDNSVVIYTGAAGAFVATPMQYIYDIDSLALRRSFNKTTMVDATSRWMADDKNVYLFSSGEDLGIFESLYFTLISNGMVSTPVLEHSYEHRPSEIKTDIVPYWIYKIEKLNKTDGFCFLDIGYDDYGRIDGFYGSELNEEVSYRWTSKSSAVYLPMDSLKNNSIALRMGAFRPVNIPAKADVIVYIDGTAIGNLSVGNDFNLYNIHVPSNFSTNENHIKLTIETVNAWKPSEVLMDSKDSRELGVIVDWVRIR